MKKKDMDRCVIFMAFCYPKSEKAIKTLITGEIYIRNFPQSQVVDSTSRLIIFCGYLSLERIDMDRYVIFIAFCYPSSENAHKNLNHL